MTFLGTHHSDFSQASSQCHEVFVAWPPCHMNCKRWQRAMQSAAFGWIQWPKKSLAQSFRIGGWTWVAVFCGIWVWVNTYENTIFRGMNIHFNPAILMWTTGVLLVLTHCHMAFQETSPWPKKRRDFVWPPKQANYRGKHRGMRCLYRQSVVMAVVKLGQGFYFTRQEQVKDANHWVKFW